MRVMRDDLEYIKRCINTLEYIERDSPLVAVLEDAINNKIVRIINHDGGPGSGNWGHIGVKGQWGGSAPGSGGKGFRVFKDGEYTSVSKDRKMGRPIIKDYGEINLSGYNISKDSTAGMYIKDGKLSPEREELHRQIIETVFLGVPKANGQPIMTFMGGGPAAGKGTVANDKSVNVPTRETTVMVDSDSIKNMLPEYREMVARGDEGAASYVHTESSILSQRIVDIGQRNGYNVMLDGTGDGSTQIMLQSIETAKEQGMRVQAIYVSCDTDKAVERAKSRARETGRMVPEEYIRETHANVSRILPVIAKDFDNVRLYDTNGNKAVLIAEGGNGQDLTILNGAMYEQFLEKGYIQQ